MKPATMYRAILILVLSCLILVGPYMSYAAAPVSEVTSSTAGSSVNDSSTYRAGELVVRFSHTRLREQNQARQALTNTGAEKVEELNNLGVERWRIPIGQELALAQTLSTLPGIEYAEPNYLLRAHVDPNDTYYPYQWAHTVINSSAAWDLTTGSGTVTVAVIDTGVDLQNTELQGRLTTGYDFANGDTDPDDDHGHGTHVAGIIAAAGNNAQGIAGMAWQTVIMPVKVLDGDGRGDDVDTAQGITYAVDNGADIINISLGGVGDSTTLHDAVKYAHDNGVLVVASGGNCGDAAYAQNGCTYQDQAVYPAAYDTEVFAVAATSDQDVVASFSNQGSYVDIAAPGVSIFSTYLNNGWATADGTSQAAPHVSGLAALLLAIDPTLTSQEIQAHIEAASVDLGSPGDDWDYGAGRIDAHATLEHAVNLTTPNLLTISNADRDGTFLVDWQDVEYATSYTLEEDVNAAFSSPVTVYNGATSQAQITDRSNGTWYYRVRAERDSISLTSDWSNTSSVKVGLDAPTLNAIDNAGADGYTVTWSESDGATGYRLQESVSEDFTSTTTRYSGPDLSYPIVNQDGGKWYYRVQATVDAVTSNWSNIQTAVVLPDPPVLTTIVAGSEPDAYTLAWTTSAGATGYRLQESSTTEFTDVITRYVGTNASYTVTGQSAGTWTYRVQAANAAGYSLPSNSESFTVTVATIPAPVLAPIADPVDEDTYTVSWSDIADAAYVLEESMSPWFEAPTIAYTGVHTHHIAIDKPPGHYHYRVRAQTASGNSPWSAIESVTVWAYAFLPVIMR